MIYFLAKLSSSKALFNLTDLPKTKPEYSLIYYKNYLKSGNFYEIATGRSEQEAKTKVSQKMAERLELELSKLESKPDDSYAKLRIGSSSRFGCHLVSNLGQTTHFEISLHGVQ